MAGMYTAPERVERDGFLVCFAGEVMSEAEAIKRGLIPEAIPDDAPDEPQEAEPVEEAQPVEDDAKAAESANESAEAKPKRRGRKPKAKA